MPTACAPDFTTLLGTPVGTAMLLKENPYCRIYRAMLADAPVIIKQYKGTDPALAIAEARALNFYHQAVADMPSIIPADAVRIDPARNIVCMSFVPGTPFTDLVNQGAHDASARKRALATMCRLGAVLRQFEARSGRRDAAPDPHHHNYLVYCSRRLEEMPVLGRLLFRGLTMDAERLWQDYCAAAAPVSFAHGDLVCANIHVDGNRTGLIDFANAVQASHALNDVYNLKLALLNMRLPVSFKQALWRSLQDGLRMPAYDPRVHDFFAEYHRRRWLMLKLRTHNPRTLYEGARGFLTFARPRALRNMFEGR